MGKFLGFPGVERRLSGPSTLAVLPDQRNYVQKETEGCAGGKIEKNEMVGACGAYGGGERGAQGSGGETWGKETTGETQTQMGG